MGLNRLLQIDEWLSVLLGRRVCRFETTDDLVQDPHAVKEAVSLLRQETTFAFAKVRADQLKTVAMLEETGFHLIETNVTLEKPVGKGSTYSGEIQIRFAKADDEAAVRQLAGKNFVYSRFHVDPRIPKDIADRVKMEWAGNFFRGRRGDSMVVAAGRFGVVGFLQLLDRKESLVIDLIGVDGGARRKGLASRMIAFAEAACTGFQRLRVGTQAVNIPSLRLYESLGFRMADVQYVLHFHHPKGWIA